MDFPRARLVQNSENFGCSQPIKILLHSIGIILSALTRRNDADIKFKCFRPQGHPLPDSESHSLVLLFISGSERERRERENMCVCGWACALQIPQSERQRTVHRVYTAFRRIMVCLHIPHSRHPTYLVARDASHVLWPVPSVTSSPTAAPHKMGGHFYDRAYIGGHA